MPTEAAPGIGAAERARLESRIRARLAPTEALARRVAEICERLPQEARRLASELGVPLVRAVVAGSAARGTYLSDRLDIDLFLLFPADLGRSELERAGLSLGAKLLVAPETRYAEHPYLRGRVGEFTVDAVPGYAVADPSHPLSAVDRTPFHQEWLSSRLNPALVEEVRLTKQFLRAQRIYGSESRTQGMSGYVVELLVVRFGSLDGVLEAARHWRPPVRLESTPGASPRVPPEVPLVLDDPVDPNRNVASALSRRNLSTFILAAEAFLAAPSAEFFEVPEPPSVSPAQALDLARARGTHVAVLRLPRPELVDDILYPQLAKAARAVAEESGRLGFAVLGVAAAAGPKELTIVLESSARELPAVRRRDGPPPGLGRVEAFLEKWNDPAAPVLQGPYVGEDGRLAVETRRPERRLEPLLTEALPRLALGRDLARALEGSPRFVALAEAEDTPELPEALGELFEKRLPWRRGR